MPLTALILVAGASLAYSQPSDAVAPDSATTPATAPAPAVEMLKRVRKSVFQVKTNDKDGLVSLGTGFVVDPTGLAITNFHVIDGATGAAASFPDIGREVTLDLVQVQPELDLALIRLHLSDPAVKEHIIPLPLQDAAPDQGADVWALGHPRGLGLTVTKGVLGAVRSFAELPDALQRQTNYDKSSEWIQTDCSINSGNSGGPLVSAGGKLIGVNTWQWLEGNNNFFALSYKHVKSLLEETRKPDIGYLAAKKLSASLPKSSSGLPTLEIKESVGASELISATRVFERMSTCSSCNAKGVRVVSRQTGVRRSGSLTVPVFENRTETCSACAGNRFTDGKQLAAGADVVIGKRVRLKRADPGADGARKTFQKSLQDLVTINASALSTTINDVAVTELTARKLQVGDPVLFVATLERDRFVADGSTRMQIVKLAGKKLRAILRDVIDTDASESETVLVAGILGGRIDGADGEMLPVLANCVVVAEKKSAKRP